MPNALREERYNEYGNSGDEIDQPFPQPLVCPALIRLPSGIRSFTGEIATVLDMFVQIVRQPAEPTHCR
jgi:hypothetical protein